MVNQLTQVANVNEALDTHDDSCARCRDGDMCEVYSDFFAMVCESCQSILANLPNNAPCTCKHSVVYDDSDVALDMLHTRIITCGPCVRAKSYWPHVCEAPAACRCKKHNHTT